MRFFDLHDVLLVGLDSENFHWAQTDLNLLVVTINFFPLAFDMSMALPQGVESALRSENQALISC